MKKILTALLVFVALGQDAQQSAASFLAPDTVCINQAFTIQNNSSGLISTNYWELCLSAPNSSVVSVLGPPAISSFGSPVYLDVQKENGNYYMFVTNNNPTSITRLSFGNSLLNAPAAFNISGVVPGQPEGIYFENVAGNWYALVVGGQPGFAGRLSFGNSLLNTPVYTGFAGIGTISYPHSIQVFESGGNKYALIINQGNSTLTRLSFGNSITNTPTGTNLGNLGGMSSPSQLALINYSGNWHAFICNSSGSTLTRLDFGNNLLSIPSGTNIGNPGNKLNDPRGINLSVECGILKGYLANHGVDTLMEISFPGGPMATPVMNYLNVTPGLKFPQTIERFREGNSKIYFIVNVFAPSITRIEVSGCNSITNPTVTNLPPISFSATGTYTLKLTCNEGKYNSSTFCKTIVVIPSFSISAVSGPSTSCINSGTVTASGNGNFPINFVWMPGSQTGSVISNVANGLYTITANSGYCQSSTTLNLTASQNLSLSVGSSTAICAGAQAVLSAGGANSYTWNPISASGPTIIVTPSVSTVYTVTGSSSGSCSASRTVAVTVNTISVNAVSKYLVCKEQSVVLSASGAQTYSWSNGATTPATTVSPSQTSTYQVVGTNTTSGCSANKTVTVTIDPCTSLNENSDAALVKIYPNPSNGIYKIELYPPGTIKIFDLSGKIIHTSQKKETTCNIDLTEYNNGIYILKTGNQYYKLLKTAQ